ncbi:nuclease domain protein [Aspergillus nomiae NRRL 13137]|uniref:Probable endonuclease LCL3 n=1 Tax=Aspergillus nomiae NRRL (strain ATCC 15546 / NRRL 13137 / CBS 260.88 / M93) TaxID=1509407 RepID=A0A0L1IN86_ASPN3|nr:nuclease domain protein [Aspergillus nomiae NRRL 13137]KNG80964.1 nuclease domain protein [Aspergillus nomiae NRRL 13137]
MRWPPWASESQAREQQDEQNKTNWNKSLNAIDWAAFTEPRTLIPTLILTTGIVGALQIRRRYLRRFPDAVSISPSYFRKRTILGQVTSVATAMVSDYTTHPEEDWRDGISVRLAGVDAPELAHFGRPEQPYAREAHEWLTSYVLNRRVRVLVHRQDQYQRVVASAYVRQALDFPIPFRRRDVSYEMLTRGLATVYEAKAGSEFGGPELERKYREAESIAKRKGTGLWKEYRRNRKGWESPREYKTRMEAQGKGD